MTNIQITTQRHYLKQLAKLTAPILITQLCQIGMATVDTIMSGRIGTVDLAAIAIGSSLWTPIWLFVAGVMVAFTPQVAKLVGANKTDEVGDILGSAVVLGIVLGIMTGLLLYNFGPMLSYLLPDPVSAELMREYIMAVSWGLPAAGAFLALRFHAEALNQPGSVTKIMIAGLLLNIPANAIFVYGWFGIEPMGGAGCGYGTTLVFHFLLVAIVYDCFQNRLPLRQKKMITFIQPRMAPMKSLIALGLPIGAAIFFEVSFFSVIALFLTPLGTVVVAGHQIAINMSSLTFMIPLSLGMAITVMVGQQVGRQQPEQAAKVSWLGVKVNFVLALFNATIIVLAAPYIAQLYSTDAEVVAIGSSLLMFAAIYQISDAIQIAAAGALRGYQDTMVVMAITFCAYWLFGVGLGYYFTFVASEPLGAKGFWLGIIIGLSIAAIMLSYRLYKVSRKTIEA
jgi:multidrug resistance protein, MATE family|tara:strand:+ start:205 stop:1563 length:1359 start_codon:yes stop_codon:yes gene_type:complete